MCICPRTCWEAAHWRLQHPNCIPLWAHVDIETLQYDLMHTKHLGVDCYFLASVMVYLVDVKMAEAPAQNLQALWTSIKTAYRELQCPSQFSTMTLNMIRGGGGPFPNLKGKASEVKHLVPALELIASQYLDRGVVEEQLMLKGLELSKAIDACIQDAGRAPRFKGTPR